MTDQIERATTLTIKAGATLRRARQTRAEIAARRTRLAADFYSAPGERMHRFALRYAQLLGEIELHNHSDSVRAQRTPRVVNSPPEPSL